MIYIVKGKEPAKLRVYKKDKNASYKDFSKAKGKEDVQVALLEEQGYLCAYCMKRINFDSIRIEHHIPQSDTNTGKELELSYQNMLGVCEGKINFSSTDTIPENLKVHCEANRGNKDLTVDPKEISTINLIKYTANGEIFSSDPEINIDLNETLHLNIQILKTNRKKILEAIIDALIIKYKTKDWTKPIIAKELEKWQSKSIDKIDNKQKFREYCGIARYNLQKRLNKYP